MSTVRVKERDLVDGGLMLRYRHTDDFSETSSAFSVCSFWWVEALAMMRELEKAVELFTAAHLRESARSLLPRHRSKAGQLLGNFPQASTHAGLIHAAVTIGELLEARDARFRAWT